MGGVDGTYEEFIRSLTKIPKTEEQLSESRLRIQLNKCIQELWKKGEERRAWELFKELFRRRYQDPEIDQKHYEVFKRNAYLITEANKAAEAEGRTAPAGFTSLCDRLNG